MTNTGRNVALLMIPRRFFRGTNVISKLDGTVCAEFEITLQLHKIEIEIGLWSIMKKQKRNRSC